MPTRPPVFRNTNTVSYAEDKERERIRAKSDRYGWDWKKFRKRMLSENPLCAQCERDGYVVEATTVHHVVDIVEAPERRLDASNIECLCEMHHNQITRYRQQNKRKS